jgi:hypothetical protein
MPKRPGTLAAALLVSLALASFLAGQESPAKHSRYNLVLLETLGGPGSQIKAAP